jgi:hydroxyethylthiazole kinase-like sugar kinase family protein
MKNLLFAAFAALSLGDAVVPAYAASTIAGDAAATRMQQTGEFGG